MRGEEKYERLEVMVDRERGVMGWVNKREVNGKRGVD